MEELLKKATEYRNSGKIEKAVEAYLALADMYIKQGNRNGEASSYHMAAVSLSEGIDTDQDRYFEKSSAYFQKAEEIYRQTRLVLMQGIVLRDKAIAYMRTGRYHDGQKVFEQSISLTKDDLCQTGMTKVKLGVDLLYIGSLHDARAKMMEGLEEISREGTSWFYLASALLELAKLDIKEEKLSDALIRLHEAQHIFDQHDREEPHPRRLYEIYSLFRIIYSYLVGKQAREVIDKEYAKLVTYID